MTVQKYSSDAVHWFVSEVTSRLVARTGNPGDRHHLGKIVLQAFKDDPEFVLQIDGATGETETFGSALTRSVQCANAFRKMGLKTNDVIVIMAPNSVHLTIPFYAGLYLGVGVAGVDMTLRVDELRDTFKIILPKIVFCQNEKASEVDKALKDINLNATIVTYDGTDSYLPFADLLKTGEDVPVAEFKASDFDPVTTISVLLSTSGTSGLPKSACISHSNLATSFPYFMIACNRFPTPTRLVLLVSPIQWLTATVINVSGPILRFTRLQSSSLLTQEHLYEIINKYRPTFSIGSPNLFMQCYKPGDRDKCDLSCFELLLVGGSAVPEILVDEIKATSPQTIVYPVYGMSEITGPALNFVNEVPGSLGGPLGSLQYKLVQPETQEEINEPNVPGELWLKGPVIFKGYYNDPEKTNEVKSEDGWLRSGDIFYRDVNWNFYFVDRLKMLLKYMNHQISPIEIEAVIIEHPGVYDVVVTGIRDVEQGDLPVACVIRNKEHQVTAQEIKDLVKESLTDTKQLRGGVIFMEEFPMTPTSKVNRAKLAAMVLDMERE